MLKRQPRLFWIGMLLYVVSFFLVAFVGSVAEPALGYWWALAALVIPASWRLSAIQPSHVFANAPLAYAALIVGGWINPLFIIAIVVGSLTHRRFMFRALRIAVFVMIPFSWIALADMLLIPREGHVAWVAGMIMALATCRSRADWSVPDMQTV